MICQKDRGKIFVHINPTGTKNLTELWRVMREKEKPFLKHKKENSVLKQKSFIEYKKKLNRNSTDGCGFIVENIT